MKIRHLLSGLRLPVTNEEQEFLIRHKDSVKITSLDERNQWVAQNLVRKGAYTISSDNCTLVRRLK